MELGIYEVERAPWILKFDGSSMEKSTGTGLVIISFKGIKTSLSFNLAFKCTNNQAEYEALVISLEILIKLGAQKVHIIEDSQLVLRQLTREYKRNILLLAPYNIASTQLLDSFHSVDFEYVLRESNWQVDELAQVASCVKMREELTHKFIVIGKKNHPSIYERGLRLEIVNTDANVAGDWRIKIIDYLEDPNRQVPYRVIAQFQNLVLMEGELYRNGLNGLLLKCLSFSNNMKVMNQVHEGVCGAHQVGIKMEWLIRRHGYFLPAIISDCINYSKGFQKCQKYDSLQRKPVMELHLIVKLWPFRGWA